MLCLGTNQTTKCDTIHREALDRIMRQVAKTNKQRQQVLDLSSDLSATCTDKVLLQDVAGR